MTEPTPEQAALARKIMDQILGLLDDMLIVEARTKLYDHPACGDNATHGLEYHAATIRYDQHGCGSGYQCNGCFEAAAARFANVVEQSGSARCWCCGQAFTAYESFVQKAAFGGGTAV